MKENYLPKISILTPSYNQGKYIEENILSVLNQNYPNFEHIIIDGGSTDNTVEILKKYPHLKWVSEPDEGQSDALNKGLAMATGEIIGWINSDDYYEKNIFNEVAKEFEDENVQWVIGNIINKYELINKYYKRKSPKVTYMTLIGSKCVMRQQGTFFRKELVLKAGGWDKDIYMCMDWDLWIRMAKISTPKMVDKYWSYFRWHDDQKSSAKNIMRQIDEWKQIYKREGVSIFTQYRVYFSSYKSLLKSQIKKILVRLHLIDKKYLHIAYFGSRKFK